MSNATANTDYGDGGGEQLYTRYTNPRTMEYEKILEERSNDKSK